VVAGQRLRHLRGDWTILETETPGPETWIRTRVNGQVRQEAQLLDMIRDPLRSSPLLARP